MLGIETKQPVDQDFVPVRFDKWLSSDDSITDAQVTITPSGELTCPSVQISGDLVKVWLAGGVDGTTYHVETVVTTLAGRIKSEVFRMRVKDE